MRAALTLPAAAAGPSGQVLRGIGLLLATAVFWGTTWPINKFMLTQLPPMSLRSFTGGFGAALIFALAAARGETLIPPPGQWLRLLGFSALNFSIWMALTTLALLWLDASEAVIVVYTMPVWTALLAWPLLHDPPTVKRLAGLAAGFAGVLVLMGAQAPAASWAKLPGMMMVLAAAVLFALGTVLMKRSPPALPPLANVGWQLGLGTLPLVVAAAGFEHPDFGRVVPLGWVVMGLNALLGSGLGYVTWFAALRRLPASTAATGALMVPIVGVSTSALALGEPLGLRQLVALLLTLLGVLLSARR